MSEEQKTSFVDMSQNINEISEALSTAQSELENVSKDSKGYGYNYADLGSTIMAVKPVIAKNGLAITQLLGQTINNKASVTTILSHKSGQFFRSESSIDIIDMKGCNTAQAQGASISYLRRYAYQAILGLSSEDADASTKGAAKPAAAKTPPKPGAKAPAAPKAPAAKTSSPSSWS